MLVSPSLLAADFANIQRDVEMLNRSEAAMIHLDVMDGVFVPNISFGFPVIEAVGRYAQKPLDVHLMIVEPQKWVSQVRDTGARIMNVHQEACLHLHRTVQAIKDAGMQAAVTLNPATPLVMLEDILPELDMVLLMTVNPGFGAQKFIEHSIDKVKRLRKMIDDAKLNTLIEVDGGVNLDTGRRLAEAGADVLVAGSYVFNAKDPLETIHSLSKL
ncbi:MAG: ribulose-phosphate 3-epimerase [Bacteroidales bacterium]|nr:ribulose-phosphate 3-epimerase [Bacteroidales bacterium]MCD8393600.1 ribulose-phosphate 3-epimerase [Bacteroidales bacterium]